jgi:hypothetical protein
LDGEEPKCAGFCVCSASYDDGVDMTRKFGTC